MATPLTTLRRYQFAFFVFFGVLLMIVFVVGDPLYSWLGGGGGGGSRQSEKTVVEWRGGNQLTESEIYNERIVRNVLREFIGALEEETRKRNGSPQVRQPLSLSPSERDIVYTKVLATKAEEMGLEVNDEGALLYLEKLSADLIPRGDIGKIFRDTIGTRISEQQALNTIKTELAAQNYIALTYPDLTRGYLPAQAWEYYRRLNRRVKAEIAPLTVADYKKKVAKEPSDAEIQALYDSAKDRYYEPSLPDPGFKRRKKVAFDFVRADRKKFEDEEVVKARPQITEQEITDYYEKNKEEFRETAEKPDVAPAATPGADKPPAESTTPAEEGKKADATPGEKPAAPSPQAETNKKPDAPADSAPQSPAESKPEDKKAQEPASEPTETAKPDATEPKGSETDPKESQSDDQAAKEDTANPDSSCQDESLKQEEKPGEPPTTEKPADANKSEAAPTQPEAAKPEETEKSKETETPASPEKKSEAAVSAQPPAQSAKPADPANDDPATLSGDKSAVKPAAEAPATSEPPKTGTTPSVPPLSYRPLDNKLREEIRDRIARQKATRAAQERVDTALNEIGRLVTKYASQKRSAELKKAKAPEPLNLEQLAQERGMQSGHIPLSDSIEVQQFELGKTFDFRFTNMQVQQISFDMLAYREDLPPYKPEQIRGEIYVHFLYWKTDEQPPFVPELKEIHNEVVEAWKQREALAIAQAEAKALAEKARKAGGTLAESIGKQENLKVTETNEFSWLTSGSVPIGMGMPALSSVDGVEHAGTEFMQSVMQLKVGEIGVAMNQPHTVVYLVRIASESPNEEVLREMFLQTGTTDELARVAQIEREGMRRSWIEQIEREMAVKWERNPES